MIWTSSWQSFLHLSIICKNTKHILPYQAHVKRAQQTWTGLQNILGKEPTYNRQQRVFTRLISERHANKIFKVLHNGSFIIYLINNEKWLIFVPWRRILSEWLCEHINDTLNNFLDLFHVERHIRRWYFVSRQLTVKHKIQILIKYKNW